MQKKALELIKEKIIKTDEVLKIYIEKRDELIKQTAKNQKLLKLYKEKCKEIVKLKQDLNKYIYIYEQFTNNYLPLQTKYEELNKQHEELKDAYSTYVNTAELKYQNTNKELNNYVAKYEEQIKVTSELENKVLDLELKLCTSEAKAAKNECSTDCVTEKEELEEKLEDSEKKNRNLKKQLSKLEHGNQELNNKIKDLLFEINLLSSKNLVKEKGDASTQSELLLIDHEVDQQLINYLLEKSVYTPPLMSPLHEMNFDITQEFKHSTWVNAVSEDFMNEQSDITFKNEIDELRTINSEKQLDEINIIENNKVDNTQNENFKVVTDEIRKYTDEVCPETLDENFDTQNKNVNLRSIQGVSEAGETKLLNNCEIFNKSEGKNEIEVSDQEQISDNRININQNKICEIDVNFVNMGATNDFNEDLSLRDITVDSLDTSAELTEEIEKIEEKLDTKNQNSDDMVELSTSLNVFIDAIISEVEISNINEELLNNTTLLESIDVELDKNQLKTEEGVNNDDKLNKEIIESLCNTINNDHDYLGPQNIQIFINRKSELNLFHVNEENSSGADEIIKSDQSSNISFGTDSVCEIENVISKNNEDNQNFEAAVGEKSETNLIPTQKNQMENLSDNENIKSDQCLKISSEVEAVIENEHVNSIIETNGECQNFLSTLNQENQIENLSDNEDTKYDQCVNKTSKFEDEDINGKIEIDDDMLQKILENIIFRETVVTPLDEDFECSKTTCTDLTIKIKCTENTSSDKNVEENNNNPIVSKILEVKNTNLNDKNVNKTLKNNTRKQLKRKLCHSSDNLEDNSLFLNKQRKLTINDSINQKLNEKLDENKELLHVIEKLEQEILEKPNIASKNNCKGKTAIPIPEKCNQKVLFEKLLNFPDELAVVNEVADALSHCTPVLIAREILDRITFDYHDKADRKYTPPAPLLTPMQRMLLGFMTKLENNGISGLFESFLNIAEKALLTEKEIQYIEPVTRMYLGVCKIQRNLQRMRKMCCDSLYFMGDLVVPFLFIVLTSWSEVLPMEINASEDPLVKVLVQVINLKNCNMPGYNLLNLRNLLNDFYGYPKERWNSEIVLNELLDNFKEKQSLKVEYAILILCKNLPNKLVFTEIENKFKPLVENNQNLLQVQAIINLIGNIVSQFGVKDISSVKNIELWLKGLLNTLPSFVEISIKISLQKLSRIK